MKRNTFFSLLWVMLITQSCATQNDGPTTSSILQLGKSSYILGCVNGMKLGTPDNKTYGLNLEICKESAQEHKETLRKILE